jgi:hypothetical protein
MDEKDKLDRRTVNANPYRGSKSGPGGDSWSPGESTVSGPEDYRDPWNPRYETWNRLRRVVRNWIGGGG